jgi:hypothetical protein
MKFYVCGFETSSLGSKTFFFREFSSEQLARDYINRVNTNPNSFFTLIEGNSLYSGDGSNLC